MTADISPEKKLEMGVNELETLMNIFSRWLKSDFDWAVGLLINEGSSGEEDEWDFLRIDWIQKYEDWLYPYLMRLHQTEHITDDQKRDFNNWAYDQIFLMLEALYGLEVKDD